jgi:gliding motility-associated-like protein
MKRYSSRTSFYPAILMGMILFYSQQSYGQCTNADFSMGNFTGWTGTYGTCSGIVAGGDCICAGASPGANTGFNQGPLNTPSNSGTEYNQTICNTGNDALLSSLGVTLPCVYPGNAYSCRIGSTFAAAEGESITYSYTVTPAFNTFTYHYAVVLLDGGHAANIAPFFHITMFDGSGNPITCADYSVDAANATGVGFDSIPNVQAGTGTSTLHYKLWTSVFIPLTAYIGQTVKITFTAESCYPAGTGCAGPHYGYAYIAAECAPLQIISSSPTVCGGQGITLTGPSGAATYSWTGPGVTAPTDSQKVVINLPGRYTLSMTTFGNNPCTFSIDTFIPPTAGSPTANFSATSPCLGGPTVFTDLSTPTGQITAWAWDFTNSGTTGSTSQNPTYTYTSAGTYQVKLTVSAGLCTNDTIISVVVAAPPTSVFTASGPICPGQTSNIIYTGTGTAGDTYNWNFGGGSVVSGSGMGPYTVNWASPGTKYITLSVSSGGCSSSQTTDSVIVYPAPGVSINPVTAICAGASVTLTATPNSPGGTYLWSPGGATANSITVSPATSTVYNVVYTALACGTASASDSVAVNSPPTLTADSATICAGSNAMITASPSVPGGAYLWTPGGSTTASITVSPAATTGYSVVYTIPGCSPASANSLVTVNQLPSVSLNDTTVCTGNSVLISATYSPAGGTFSWTPGGAVTSSITVSPAATTIYTVTYTAPACGSATGTGTVTIVSGTSVTVYDTGVCAGSSAVLTAVPTIPGGTYLWSPGGANVPSITVTPTATTTYTVTYTTINCGSATASPIVTIFPLPTLSLIPDNPGCGAPDIGSMVAKASVGAAPYHYALNGGAYQPNDTFNGLVPGSYSVMATDAHGCISAPSTAAIISNTTLTASLSFLPPDTTLQYGQSVQMQVTLHTSPAPASTSYLWSPATGLSCTDCPNPVALVYAAANVYTVTATYTTFNGPCTVDASVTVHVDQNIPLYIPNSFSPNGDGTNDVFYIYGSYIKLVDLKIFNRWGEKVFESLDQYIGWDGRYKGTMQSPDIYPYEANVTFLNGTSVFRKGSITLLR